MASSVILLATIYLPAVAATPGTMSFQGYLTDSQTGDPLNGPFNITFSIWDDSISTEPMHRLWQEPRSVQVNGGQLSLLLGSRIPLAPNFFGGPERYLEIWIEGDPSGPTRPRIPLASVPFSFRVRTLDGASGGVINGAVAVSDTLTVGSLRIPDGAEEGYVLTAKSSGDAGWAEAPWGSDSLCQCQDQFEVLQGDGMATITLDASEAMSSGGGAAIKLSDGTQNTISLDARGIGGGARVRLYNSSGDLSLDLDGNDSDAGAILVYGTGDETVAIVGSEDGTDGGQITIRNRNEASTVVVDGDSEDHGQPNHGSVRIYSGGTLTNNYLNIRLSAGRTNSAGEISMFDIAGSVETVEILGVRTEGEGGQIKVRDASGTTNITLNGESGRLTTSIVEITGGADLSERFQVHGIRIEPGMVVSIDAKRPGALVISTRAYDRAAAGIISGAGGVNPGMLMGQSGSLADGEYPVALTGRVYCWADASEGPIQPGDLLTTSETAGYAMRVGNYEKARGAIIGKAMTSLESGTGLVLALLTLQ
jgi:hypothetical protein